MSTHPPLKREMATTGKRQREGAGGRSAFEMVGNFPPILHVMAFLARLHALGSCPHPTSPVKKTPHDQRETQPQIDPLSARFPGAWQREWFVDRSFSLQAVAKFRIAAAGRPSSNRRRWFLAREVSRRGNLLAIAFSLLLAASVADASGMSSPSKTRMLLHESESRRPAMQRSISGLPEKEVAPLTPQAYNEFLRAASDIKVLQVQYRLLIRVGRVPFE